MIKTVAFSMLFVMTYLSQSMVAQAQVVYCPTAGAVMSDGIHIVYRTVRMELLGLCTCALSDRIHHYQIDPNGIAVDSCLAPPLECECSATQDPIGESGGSSVISFNPNDATMAYFENPNSYDIWVETEDGNIMRCFFIQSSNNTTFRFAYKSTISDPDDLPAWVNVQTYTATESNDHVTVTEPGGTFSYYKKVGN